jgi:pilus assembly protein CpaE
MKDVLGLSPSQENTSEQADIGIHRSIAVAVAVAVPEAKLRRQVLEALQTLSVPVVEDQCDTDRYESLVATIARLRPSILFLGMGGLPADSALVLARLAGLDSAPRIIAVSETAEPEVILKAMRAGAAEFVYPPLPSQLFTDAVRRVITDCNRSAGEERATGALVGFVSAKGGCGATTLACHTASHLRIVTKKEILLADLDLASGITGSLMQTEARYSLEDALQNLHRMDLKLWKALVAGSPSGVDVIPAPPDSLVAPVTPLTRKMPQMLRFWRMHYDFTILDLGHGMTPPLLDVLDLLDTLILVTTNEVLALRLAKQMIQSLAARDFGANRLKLVINRMPKRTQIELPELERVMGHSIYAAVPNDYQRLNEAYSEPRLVDANCDLGMEIGKLAAKLAGVHDLEKPARKFFGLVRKKK